MRHNAKINAFLDKLAAAGVTYRTNWETRRDRKPLSNARPFGDVIHLSFVGNGFDPSVGTAIIIDYGDRDGFGIYYEAETNSIDDDVARIAARRGSKPNEGQALALLQTALADWPQFDKPHALLSPGPIPEEDEDQNINGGDMVEWFSGFREKAKVIIAGAVASTSGNQTASSTMVATLNWLAIQFRDRANDDPAEHTEQDASQVEAARDAAGNMLGALKALLPEIDSEIEQRQHGGNDEDWQELKALSDAGHAAIAKAEGR